WWLRAWLQGLGKPPGSRPTSLRDSSSLFARVRTMWRARSGPGCPVRPYTPRSSTGRPLLPWRLFLRRQRSLGNGSAAPGSRGDSGAACDFGPHSSAPPISEICVDADSAFRLCLEFWAVGDRGYLARRSRQASRCPQTVRKSSVEAIGALVVAAPRG